MFDATSVESTLEDYILSDKDYEAKSSDKKVNDAFNKTEETESKESGSSVDFDF